MHSHAERGNDQTGINPLATGFCIQSEMNLALTYGE